MKQQDRNLFNDIITGDAKAVDEALLKDSTLINLQNGQSQTPLMLAVAYEHRAVVEVCLKYNPNLELEDIFHKTVLDYAKIAKDETIRNLILAKYQEGLTKEKFFSAISKNQPKTVEELAKTFSGDTDEKGNTAMHYVGRSGHHAQLLDILYKNYVALDKPNHEQQTALHLAAAHGHAATLVALMEKGASPKSTDHEGHTPTALAVMAGKEKILTALKERDVDFKVCDREERNLLHLAAEYHQFSILTQLVLTQDLRTLIHAVDKRGYTVLHCACQHDDAKPIIFLHYHGAHLKVLDHEGLSPIEHACKKGHLTVIETLLDLGDDISAETEKTLKENKSEKNEKILSLLGNVHARRHVTHRVKSSAPIQNLVFQGGGPKGVGYLGALDKLFSDSKRDSSTKNTSSLYLKDIHRIAGTSAGAIIAALLCTGHKTDEVIKLIKKDKFTDLLDGDHKDSFLKLKTEFPKGNFSLWAIFKKIITNPLFYSSFFSKLTKDCGLFAGEIFRQRLDGYIKDKVGKENLTFIELHELKINKPDEFKDLYIVAANLNTATTDTFSYEHTPDLIIADAVRMSGSIPFIFVPHRQYIKKNGKRILLHNSARYVDGGIQDNYILSLFDFNRYRDDIPKAHQEIEGVTQNPQTLGFRIVTKRLKDNYEQKKQSSLEEREKEDFGLYDLLFDMLGSYINKQESDHARSGGSSRTIYIDGRDISLFDFDLSERDTHSLIDAGHVAVEDYLQRQSFERQSQHLDKNLLCSLVKNSDQYHLTLNHNLSLDLRFTLSPRAPSLIYDFHKYEEENMSFLKKIGISLHARDDAGNTAIHLAIHAMDMKAMTSLIKMKADLNIKNYAGQFPLDLLLSAYEKNKQKFSKPLKQLLQAGAQQCAESSQKKLIAFCEKWLGEEEDEELQNALNALKKPKGDDEKKSASVEKQPPTQDRVSPSSAGLFSTTTTSTTLSTSTTSPKPGDLGVL